VEDPVYTLKVGVNVLASANIGLNKFETGIALDMLHI
jgi:hypothetical protein